MSEGYSVLLCGRLDSLHLINPIRAENIMFRDLLSSRLIQGGMVFFVLVVGGSLLYSWHVHRTTIAEFKPIPQSVVSSPENTVPTNTAPVVFQNDGITNTPNETTAVETIDETEALDLTDAFLPDDMATAETPAEEEVVVSPYGFGPYPEIPADYPSDRRNAFPWLWSEEKKAKSEARHTKFLEERGSSFTEYLKRYELMGRVGIKMWNEGRDFSGITTSHRTGLFYPDEPNVLYVKWRETTDPNGEVRRYMGKTIGSALQNMPIAAMQGREPPPDWIEIRSLNDGIDPYEYLGLNR